MNGNLRRAVRAVLALILTAGSVGMWIAVLVLGTDTVSMDVAKEASGAIGPLTGMALTFYFREQD